MGGRRFTHPVAGDTLATIAAREVPDLEGGAEQLLSWNLHLAARAPIGPPGSVLASDIVFLEPPQPR
ncbi:MAG: hypothetical protein S0880_26735 [Actinomycetota bacterium]|nr:hypothetical protein [Actinomycetota bacterium]